MWLGKRCSGVWKKRSRFGSTRASKSASHGPKHFVQEPARSTVFSAKAVRSCEPDTDGTKAGSHNGQMDSSGHTGSHRGASSGSAATVPRPSTSIIPAAPQHPAAGSIEGPDEMQLMTMRIVPMRLWKASGRYSPTNRLCQRRTHLCQRRAHLCRPRRRRLQRCYLQRRWCPQRS